MARITYLLKFVNLILTCLSELDNSKIQKKSFDLVINLQDFGVVEQPVNYGVCRKLAGIAGPSPSACDNARSASWLFVRLVAFFLLYVS